MKSKRLKLLEPLIAKRGYITKPINNEKILKYKSKPKILKYNENSFLRDSPKLNQHKIIYEFYQKSSTLKNRTKAKKDNMNISSNKYYFLNLPSVF